MGPPKIILNIISWTLVKCLDIVWKVFGATKNFLQIFGNTFDVQAMLLSKLANGLLGALSGCVGETILGRNLSNGMSRLFQIVLRA